MAHYWGDVPCFEWDRCACTRSVLQMLSCYYRPRKHLHIVPTDYATWNASCFQSLCSIRTVTYMNSSPLVLPVGILTWSAIYMELFTYCRNFPRQDKLRWIVKYQKGKEGNLGTSNYRPISLLIVFPNILENLDKK